MNHHTPIHRGFIQHIKAFYYRKSTFCPKIMPLNVKGNVIHAQNMSGFIDCSML